MGNERSGSPGGGFEGHHTYTCDRIAAGETYAVRFRGPVGERLLGRQSELVAAMAGDLRGLSVLDVGGGHGHAAGVLARAGAKITVHASASDAFGGLRGADAPPHRRSVGALFPLPFGDRSFHTVVSLRTVSHVPEWEPFVSELCRVADRRVIFDFASTGGPGRLGPIFFAWKRGVEKDTRRFTLQSRGGVRRALEESGFRAERLAGQFVFPFALHRALRTPLLFPLERLLAGAGLTERFGSPVLAAAARMDP